MGRFSVRRLLGRAGTGAAPSSPPTRGAGSGGSSVPPPPDGRRRRVEELLGQIEAVRPGTVRRRVLELQGDRDRLAGVLGELFTECDALDGATTPLPFDDEWFDVVRCGPGAGADLAEVLRVLRLRGVAVVDLSDETPPAAPQATPADAPLLDAEISAPAAVSLAPGAVGTVDVALTNRGWRTWQGSGIHHLELRCAVDRRRSAVTLAGSVIPSDSYELELPLRAPDAPGEHTVELQLVATTSGRPPLRSAIRRVTLTVGEPGFADGVRRAGGVVLGSVPLDPPAASGGGGVRYFVARP